MKLLQWFLGVGISGYVLVGVGVAIKRDGIAIAGSIIIAAVAISLAMLTREK